MWFRGLAGRDAGRRPAAPLPHALDVEQRYGVISGAPGGDVRTGTVYRDPENTLRTASRAAGSPAAPRTQVTSRSARNQVSCRFA